MFSTPRPILKRSPSQHPPPHAVHFPSSPLLTRTFDAHPRESYDRSPIVVSPNSCALPERGGRCYTLDDSQSLYKGLHPRALATIPDLIPDLSGSSDESDGIASPPPEAYYFPRTSPPKKSKPTFSDDLPFPPSPQTKKKCAAKRRAICKARDREREESGGCLDGF
ncbi:hypothetical protein ARMSODRAFT_954699 [Armillaria solidipes]|uniref:Uncharacterized protein n=1 Tax=Armillaria solidipes TaxID=1076256 RepID=A0A2H3BM01_9AGAR|nr:hypothetical protein ARMSODRAFT_954699 [Armillaria solidipes]